MRSCKICKKELKGRSDKIFCSIGCKNEYHRRLRQTAKKAGIQIDGYLKRNYKILIEVLKHNKTQVKVKRSLLAKKGFRFKYHTHYHINSRNKTYFYIYDIAWMQFSDDEVLVVKK